MWLQLILPEGVNVLHYVEIQPEELQLNALGAFKTKLRTRIRADEITKKQRVLRALFTDPTVSFLSVFRDLPHRPTFADTSSLVARPQPTWLPCLMYPIADSASLRRS